MMFGEAKLALILGVGLVIAGAVVFFRKDFIQANTPPDSIAPAAQKEMPDDSNPATQLRSCIARPM
jgi:hypothetical protein